MSLFDNLRRFTGQNPRENPGEGLDPNIPAIAKGMPTNQPQESQQSGIAKMFSQGDPELRERLIQQQQQEIEEAQRNKKLVEDEHNDTMVREAHQELITNPATRESMKRVTEDMVGAKPGELVVPGEDGKSAMDKKNQVTEFLAKRAQAQETGLTADLQADIARLDNELAWLDKDKKDMTQQELLGVGLIAVLPALIGMMAGGKRGLMAGIAAGLSGAGKQLQGGGLSDQERVKAIIELQKVKSGKQGLQAAIGEAQDKAALEAAKLSGDAGPLALKMDVVNNLGVDPKEVEALDEKQLKKVQTFGEGLQNLGYEIEKPKVIAGLTDTEVPKARDALAALDNLEKTLLQMKDIAHKSGGAFSIGSQFTGELFETDEAVILNTIQNEGLSIVRNFQQAGANLTQMEIVLGQAIIPDLTGLQSGFETDKAVLRVNESIKALQKQREIMMKRYGLRASGLTLSERDELERLEQKLADTEGEE